MSNKDLCKGKRLTIEYRLAIKYGLDQNYTLKEIVESSTNCRSKLNRYPYVCNACTKLTTCMAEKHYYKVKVKETKYKETLVFSREWLNATVLYFIPFNKIQKYSRYI